MSIKSDYTPEERQQLEEINKRYAPMLKEAQAALMGLDIIKDKEAYYEATASFTNINESLQAEIDDIEDAKDFRIIQSYDGDTVTLAEDLREEIPGFLKSAELMAGKKPTPEERKTAAAERAKTKKETETAIKHNEKLLKEDPNNEEIKAATEELYKLLENLPPYSIYEQIYGDGKNLWRHFSEVYKNYLEYLKQADGYRYYELLTDIKEIWAGIYGKRGDYSYINELFTKPGYRTRTKARKAGAVKDMPTALIIPTTPSFQNSMSLYQNDRAYLQPLRSTEGIKFKDGRLYFDGVAQPELEAELQNLKTKEGIEYIDLPILHVFYSIILTQFEKGGYKTLADYLTVHVADLAEYLGLRSNLNKADIDHVIEKTQSYHNIVGVIHHDNGRKSLYQVLNFESYNDKNNTITFSSPYMNYVIKTVYNLATRKNKAGQAKLKQNGTPLFKPTNSYLIDSSIAKERNKAAVMNVEIIVTLIEQAGDNIPRIKASTLIERNVQLADRLESAANPRTLLNRTFIRTWELLREKTRLTEVYKDIQLPDPKDPAAIPTMKTLDNVVFSFPHNGKK